MKEIKLPTKQEAQKLADEFRAALDPFTKSDGPAFGFIIHVVEQELLGMPDAYAGTVSCKCYGNDLKLIDSIVQAMVDREEIAEVILNAASRFAAKEFPDVEKVS